MPDAPTHHDARPQLPKTVRLLGWISFFADISSEMAYPLLPLLVVGVLGASASSLGAIEGVAAVVVAGLTAWAGWRSDGGSRGRRARRRLPWIRWGYGLPVLGKTLLAVATGWTVVLAGRSIDRVGKGFRSSPRDALIADATEPTERGRAFGFHRGMDTAGALCGVVISGIALWWLGPSEGTDLEHALRVVLGIAAAMSLASFVLTFRLREPPPEPAPAGPIEDVVVEPAPGVMQAIASLPRRYFLSILPMVVFALGNSTDAFLLLRASDLGWSPLAVVGVYAMYNVTFASVSYPAGILSDRIGRWRLLGSGWGLYAAVYVGFAVGPAWAVWVLMPVYGLYGAMSDGIGKALITDVVPSSRRGTALGVFSLATGCATLVGSLIAGVVWDHVGHGAPFLIGAAFAVIALAMIRWVR